MSERQRHVPFACPKCGLPPVTVEETRPWDGTIRRRRSCANGHTMATREVPERDYRIEKITPVVSEAA